MKIQYVEVTEKTLTLMNSDVVPAHTIRVDGKPLTAGSKAPAGCEYVFEEQHDGWFKQMVRRLPQEFKRNDIGDTQHQLTLGQLIALLEPYAGKVDSDMFPDTERCILFWGDVVPDGKIDSYRGIYAHLAIGYTVSKRYGDDEPTVIDFVAALKSKIGSVMDGYKGGTYKMSEETPIWAANYGNLGVHIVGIKANNWDVELVVGEKE